MTERSRFWDGSTTGDAVSITDNELMDRFFRAILNGTGNQGVLKGWANELEVTDGGGLNASINTGAAILYGGFYESTAVETVACPDNSTVHVVVRRDWATSQSRLTQVAALVQTPDTTYDIPLAEVTTVGGAITLITDERDFCEYTTQLVGPVETDHIADDAVTPAKLENQTRCFFRGAGTLEPDITSPAALASYSTYHPHNAAWEYVDAATTRAWCTFRAPEDIVVTNVDVYLWMLTPSNGDVVFTADSWDAQPSAALATQSFSVPVTYSGSGVMKRLWHSTFTYTAGDVVHFRLSRIGASGSDTLADSVWLYMIEFEYTADS